MLKVAKQALRSAATIKKSPWPFHERGGGSYSPIKNLNEIVNGLKRLVQFLGIISSCLSKIRPTSPCSSDAKSNLFDQLIRLETMGEVGGHPHDQGDFVLTLSPEKDDSRSDLSFQLVNELPHPFYIFPVHLGGKDFHASYLSDKRKKVREFLMG
jgi:hypothetical protein